MDFFVYTYNEVFQILIHSSVRISYLLQPYIEPTWHVGQREELVQPLGHVLCVDPEVRRPECGDRDEQA